MTTNNHARRHAVIADLVKNAQHDLKMADCIMLPGVAC